MELTIEKAKEEFEKWLEHKKIKPSRRKTYETQEETLVEAIADGDLVLKDDFTFEYTLLTPVETDNGEVILDKLVFKPRIRKQELINHYKGLKPDDADGRLLATMAALTDRTEAKMPITRQLIGKIYTEDMAVCESLAIYFL